MNIVLKTILSQKNSVFANSNLMNKQVKLHILKSIHFPVPRVDQEHHLDNLHEELLVSDFTTNQMKKIFLPHQRCGRNDDGIDEKTSPNTKHI